MRNATSIYMANVIDRCNCGTHFCFECGLEEIDCRCPELQLANYDNRGPLKTANRLHTWTTNAGGLEAEVEVRSWPEHEKVIINATEGDEQDTGCPHLRVMATAGKSRCHGCLQIFDSLKRCYDCNIELCIICRPQMPNYEMEL
jgi:hypothetical protein